MVDTKTYHKCLMKITRFLQRKHNVGLDVEFNGFDSMFSLNKNKNVVFTEIPIFLINIRTKENLYSTDILESLDFIKFSFGGFISFRYKLNGNHFFPLKTPEFLM